MERFAADGTLVNFLVVGIIKPVGPGFTCPQVFNPYFVTAAAIAGFILHQLSQLHPIYSR